MALADPQSPSLIIGLAYTYNGQSRGTGNSAIQNGDVVPLIGEDSRYGLRVVTTGGEDIYVPQGTLEGYLPSQT